MSRQTDGGKQMLTKNQLVEAQITAMSSDGNGIAKVDGMVIFVPYSAVGDKLLVRVVKGLKHYSFGIRPHFGAGRRTGAGQLPGLPPLRGMLLSPYQLPGRACT